MNKLINLSLIAVSMFLASCGNNGGGSSVQEYNVTYKYTEVPAGGEVPTVTSPNTIKSNEEALVTLKYNSVTAPTTQAGAISLPENISIKDYAQVDSKTATFKIYDAIGDVVITLFRIE